MSTGIEITQSFSSQLFTEISVTDEDFEVTPQRDGVSEEAFIQVEGNQFKTQEEKVAYIWLKVSPDDKAFRGPSNDESREMTIEYLEKNHYKVTLFQDEEFLPHIMSDSTPIDLLIISGHGSPQTLQGLRIQRDKIMQTSCFFFSPQRFELMDRLSFIMKKKSVIVLDACLTGNKSVEGNFSHVFSKSIPQATVYSSQDRTRKEPYIRLDAEGIVEQVIYMSGKYGDPKSSVVYRNGKEITDQAPLCYQARNRGYLPYVSQMIYGTVEYVTLATSDYFSSITSGSWDALAADNF
ncbi:MAG: hypothetical protein H7A41_03955 [Chlamydiales bacterium]|nr:hypothetical protein [Chlamydiales bacterium]